MRGVAALTAWLAMASSLAPTTPDAAPVPAPWFAFEPGHDTFGPSVLDLTPLIEAPTGRHGFLHVEGERLVFEDGTLARLFGCQLALMEKDDLDYALRRLRKLGVNAVRLHGLEFLNDRRGRSILDYDEEAFARLDYTVAALGEQGLYLILDADYPLITRLGPADQIAGLPDGGPAPLAEFFDPAVARLKWQRMRDVYTRHNPYTGRRYCDDPTLALVEIQNEDSLFWYAVDSMGEPRRGQLERRFAEWLAGRYRNDAALRKAWSYVGQSPLAEGESIEPGGRVALLPMASFEGETVALHPVRRRRAQDQLRFYLDLEEAYWEASRRVLREAGVRVPIAATNWAGGGFTTRIHLDGQAQLDYIDRHGYWDHPAGAGEERWRIAGCLFHDQPMVRETAGSSDGPLEMGVGNLVIAKAWEQVLGKPMTISEWNTCLPNEYSLEGPGIMAAYGSMQGWDALLEFGLFSPDWRPQLGPGSFDLMGNPPQLLQFPAVATLWHRQDVQEAPVVGETVVGRDQLFDLADDRRPLPLDAALIGRVGYRFTPVARPGSVRDIGRYWDAKTRTARSVTGELAWAGDAGVVTIDTPRTQAVIGFLGARERRLTNVLLASDTGFGAVYVTAMDGERPIGSARRLLVTAVGRARNTGMEYEHTTQPVPDRGGRYSRLRVVGTAPVLLEQVCGDLRIRSEEAERLRAWILDMNGGRRGEVALRVTPGFVTLALDATQRAVYYELALE